MSAYARCKSSPTVFIEECEMNDLISRKQAIKLLNLNKPNVDEKTKYAMWQFDKDLQTIKTMSSAEKIGKWVLVDEAEPRRYGCSCCKRLSYTMDNYCSYCGARMVE